MKRILAFALVVTYAAFAPACFAHTMGSVPHVHGEGEEVLVDPGCSGQHDACATPPLSEILGHANMYHSVTASSPVQSVTTVIVLLFVSVVFLRLVERPQVFTPASYSPVFHQERERRSSASLKRTQGSWITRLISSPPSSDTHA
jgi:hypothetical protein